MASHHKKKLEIAIEGEEHFLLSLTEISSSFKIPEQTIYEMIEEGILSGNKESTKELSFDEAALRQARIVLRLHQDLGINMAGAALVLDLLQEIEDLHTRLQILENPK